MSNSNLRLAFVIPWYGVDVIGGAELECRKTAEHLVAAGFPVEILTTTARDLFTGWSADHHREGRTIENGVTVRRFRLTKEPLVKYGEINSRLMAGRKITREEELLFLNESVNSERLYQYIAEESDRYQLLFIPYLFGTTYRGAQIAPERSWIIPCLHDEGYARMSVLGDLFRNVQGLIFHSSTERDLARRLYNIDDERLLLWGEGVDMVGVGNELRFREKFGIEGPFVLYVGRKDGTKNVPRLVEYFTRYLSLETTPLKLVLAGKGDVDIPRRYSEQIVDIGSIGEQDKLDGYASALVLCQPSVNESFSLVIMESWLQGTPVLVNAVCEPTSEHCRASSGGLAFRGFAEFAGCLDWYLEHPEKRRRMGELGREYVVANYHWDKIVGRYARLLG